MKVRNTFLIALLVLTAFFVLVVQPGNAAGELVAPAPVWMAESNQENARLGFSTGYAHAKNIDITAFGDFNDDGHPDLAAGALQWSNPELHEGGVFVWYGSESGLGEGGNPDNADWTMETNQAGARIHTLTVGDVNGDGVDDLLIGSAEYSHGQDYEGMVFVWHGSPNGLGETGTPENAAWTAESNATGTLGDDLPAFGESLTAADFNGDGYADLAIGSPGYLTYGSVFVWHGSKNGLGENGTPDNADWVASGEVDCWAWGTVEAGDFNGDSFADLAIGSPGCTVQVQEDGGIFIFSGSSSGLGENADWHTTGGSAYAHLGNHLAAGDLNGDGSADLAAGEDRFSAGQTYEGAVLVWYSPGVSGKTTPDWMAQSNQERAFMSPVAIGDANGDGCEDLFASAPWYSHGQTSEGLVLAWFGAAHGLGANGNPLNADWIAASNQAYAMLGSSLALADGKLAVGAGFYDNGEVNEGAVFVFAEYLPPERNLIYLPLILK